MDGRPIRFLLDGLDVRDLAGRVDEPNRRRYEAARRRARARYDSTGFRRAYLLGALAAIEGRPADSCPYDRDVRKTWRAVYRKAWLTGWETTKGAAA